MARSKESEPKVFEGGLALDDRGGVSFVNDFPAAGIKRFYVVSNHRPNFIRAWHAHKKEDKYVTVVSGSALVAAVKIDNWQRPSRKAKIFRFVMSASRPALIFIPRGFANGFMNLTPEAKVMYFSTSTVAESQADDFRFDAHYWDPWQIVER